MEQTALTKCIITSASNKYFPSLINMIGSFKKNYPDHPQIFVYDLGLSSLFKKELIQIERVSVLQIPHFVPHWRNCYTWKTYILNTPLAELNFYIDAGCQILRPLDEVFDKIERNEYLLVSQGNEVLAKDITPEEYSEMFEVDEKKLDSVIIAAGIFGFKKGASIQTVTRQLWNAGVSGLCIGFSKQEQWKNKGVNKNNFIRDCRFFRHDTTMLTLLVLKYISQPIIEDIKYFEGHKTGDPSQLVWNLRMNYSKLEYIDILKLTIPSRIFVFFFMQAKKINSFLKSLKSKIKR